MGTATTTHTYACAGSFESSVTSAGEKDTAPVLIAGSRLPSPANVRVTAGIGTDRRVKITWDAVEHADGYTAVATPDSGPAIVGIVTGTTAAFSAVVPGMTYTASVIAKGSCDYTDSDPSGTSWCSASAATLLSASGITATTFTASWTAAPGADGYKIYASSSAGSLPDQSTTGTTATFTAAAAAHAYVVYVDASQSGCLTTSAGPLNVLTAWSTPTDLAATDVTSQTFTVSWSKVPDGDGGIAAGYVARATAAGAPQLTGVVTGTTAKFSGAMPDTKYTIQVIARGGDFPDSDAGTLDVTTETQLPAPTDVQATSIDCSGVATVTFTSGAPATSWTVTADDSVDDPIVAQFTSTAGTIPLLADKTYTISVVAHAPDAADSPAGTGSACTSSDVGQLAAGPIVHAQQFTVTWPNTITSGTVVATATATGSAAVTGIVTGNSASFENAVPGVLYDVSVRVDKAGCLSWCRLLGGLQTWPGVWQDVPSRWATWTDLEAEVPTWDAMTTGA